MADTRPGLAQTDKAPVLADRTFLAGADLDRGRITAIKGYGRILVTGPQRSGTRIAARIIAHDTGHAYVDEAEFEVHRGSLFDGILKDRSQIVVHCPGMCYAIEKYSDDDTLIVMMIRPISDIIASEQRIGWKHGPYHEYERYGIDRLKARWERRHGRPISQIKYDHWHSYQRDRIRHYLELDYQSLSDHPLWVPKERRLNFAYNQTSLTPEI